MARDLTPAVKTAIDQSILRLAVLTEFQFEGGTTRYWSGVGNLSWNAQTWLGTGALGGISAIEEAGGTQAPGVTFEISGIDSSQISLALTDNYQGRVAKAWLALFDASDALIADPSLIFNGRMDVMQITDAGETSSISLQCEGRSIEFSRSKELRYTDQEQRRLFPGDLGLQYVASLQGKKLPWGMASVRAPSTPGRPGGFGWSDYEAHIP